MTQASGATMPDHEDFAVAAEPLADRLARARDLLEQVRPDLPRHIRLDWQDTRLDVSLTNGPDARALLRIAGCLGILPYTVENAAARRSALALLARLTGAEDVDHIRVDSHGAVWLDSRTRCPVPTNEADFLASVVIVLFSLESRLLALHRELLPARVALGAVETH